MPGRKSRKNKATSLVSSFKRDINSLHSAGDERSDGCKFWELSLESYPGTSSSLRGSSLTKPVCSFSTGGHFSSECVVALGENRVLHGSRGWLLPQSLQPPDVTVLIQRQCRDALSPGAVTPGKDLQARNSWQREEGKNSAGIVFICVKHKGCIKYVNSWSLSWFKPFTINQDSQKKSWRWWRLSPCLSTKLPVQMLPSFSSAQPCCVRM